MVVNDPPPADKGFQSDVSGVGAPSGGYDGLVYQIVWRWKVAVTGPPPRDGLPPDDSASK
jgi:hypothetical protein